VAGEEKSGQEAKAKAKRKGIKQGTSKEQAKR
jgi:hypothetical protein